MIYNNLIFFLIAIVLFSTNVPAGTPPFSGLITSLLYLLSLVVYFGVCKMLFRRVGLSSGRYFKAEKQGTVFGLFFFGYLIYGLDIKYYLTPASIESTLPSLANVAGIILFFGYFVVLWLVARPCYEKVFDRTYRAIDFTFFNLKSNLPIILPWLILSFFHDLLLLIPSDGIKDFLASFWGDLIFFAVLLVLIMFIFPPLIRRLWGCTRLPDGSLRDSLESFCRKQDFTAELYLWPLFEGRVLTAAVMGFVPGLRYILLTPAIIEAMTREELESIMAHEIGHVKRYHMFLYIFLILGFSIFVGFLIEPALRVVFSYDFLIDWMVKQDLAPEQVFVYAGTASVLFFLVIYFRVIFGYYIRNFERQADAHVFKAVGNATHLISSFERLARLSGDSRDKPSWHHFGIGERVDFLEDCQRDPAHIKRQDTKVRLSLLIYVLVLVLTVGLVGKFPTEKYINQYKEKYTEAYLIDKIENGSEDFRVLRLAGEFMSFRGKEELALAAYEMALDINENDPENLNSLAWLMLTSKNLQLRKPLRALRYAKMAAKIKPAGHILDTLATAYWANGFIKEALATEEQAVLVDKSRAAFYRKQAKKFNSITYEQELQQLKGELE